MTAYEMDFFMLTIQEASRIINICDIRVTAKLSPNMSIQEYLPSHFESEFFAYLYFK